MSDRWDSHQVPTRFDMGRTLTNERTDVTDVHQDSGEKSHLPYGSAIVDEIESMRLDFGIPNDLAVNFASHERVTVRNHEPRPLAGENRKLWGAIMCRDEGTCWMCLNNQSGPVYVLDHLEPRSGFAPHEIHVADRSDNLRIACWACNQAKSNRLIPFRKPLPVVWQCADCYRVDGEAPWWMEDFSTQSMAAFCARHSTTTIVPADWPIASLVMEVAS